MEWTPKVFDPVDLFTEQALTVSGGATPSATSEPQLRVEMLSKIQVTVANTGPSTNVTVKIWAVNKATGGIAWVLRPFTLGASGTDSASAGCYIERGAIPIFIYATAVNSDAANAAEITVTVDRWR